MTPEVFALMDRDWIEDELDIMDSEAKIAANRARQQAQAVPPMRTGSRA